MTLRVGDKAPDFTLPDQTGKQVTLSDRLGEKVVVLYFYPKDNTRGCTAEACSFRDSYESFTDSRRRVIGVSSDSVESHEKFAGRHELPFTLLADRDRAVRRRVRRHHAGRGPRPDHLRDRPGGRHPARVLLDDEHRRPCRRRPDDRQAAPARVLRIPRTGHLWGGGDRPPPRAVRQR